MKSTFVVVRDEKMTPKVPTAQKCCIKVWPKTDLRDHENEDHVWAKNKGKPGENQWFLKIAHDRKWKSVKNAVFPKVPTAQKCCRRQYEINIIVVRD